jgi:hypothetical protein
LFLETGMTDDQPNIKQRILKASEDFVQAHGKAPTGVNLRLEDERDILKLGSREIGELAGQCLLRGARDVFQDGILGLAVTWDAPAFGVS